jgi:hypothetical protein
MIDFTVIVNVRQQFGDKDLNLGVFAGEQKEFLFDSPGVDASKTALLLFQLMNLAGSDNREHILEINGSVVFGGIPRGPVSFPVFSPGTSDARILGVVATGWSGQVLLVTPNTLKQSGNVVRVASVEKNEFAIDNMVLLYRQLPASHFPDVVTPVA